MATKDQTQATPKKQRLSVDVPAGLLTSVRDLVVYLQRKGSPDEPDSMAGLVTLFVEDGIAKMKKTHKLRKIPSRAAAGKLRTGRRLK